MTPFLLSGLLLMQELPGAPPEPPVALEDVEVIASPARARIDAFGYFRTFCFDGNRLNSRATHPAEDSLWVPLEDQERRTLALSDEASAYLYESERLTLVLRIEERTEGFLRRHTCSLAITGEHDPDEVVRGMTQAFGGRGTTRHLDYPESYPRLPGWTQLAWAAIPARSDPDWRVFGSSRRARAEPGFVVVTEPWFYANSRYVVGEIKFSSTGDLPVSIVALTHLFKR